MVQGWSEYHDLRMVVELDYSAEGEEYEEVLALYPQGQLVPPLDGVARRLRGRGAADDGAGAALRLGRRGAGTPDPRPRLIRCAPAATVTACAWRAAARIARGGRPSYTASRRGCSSMVEPQPSKLVMRVRFPSPAPSFRAACTRPPPRPPPAVPAALPRARLASCAWSSAASSARAPARASFSDARASAVAATHGPRRRLLPRAAHPACVPARRRRRSTVRRSAGWLPLHRGLAGDRGRDAGAAFGRRGLLAQPIGQRAPRLVQRDAAQPQQHLQADRAPLLSPPPAPTRSRAKRVRHQAALRLRPAAALASIRGASATASSTAGSVPAR